MREWNVSRYELFETSPETIEQELVNLREFEVIIPSLFTVIQSIHGHDQSHNVSGVLTITRTVYPDNRCPMDGSV